MRVTDALATRALIASLMSVSRKVFSRTRRGFVEIVVAVQVEVHEIKSGLGKCRHISTEKDFTTPHPTCSLNFQVKSSPSF